MKEAEGITFDPYPSAPGVKNWKTSIKKKVSAASARPELAYQWFFEVGAANSWEPFEESGNFETLDAKIASALFRLCSGERKRIIRSAEPMGIKRTWSPHW